MRRPAGRASGALTDSVLVGLAALGDLLLILGWLADDLSMIQVMALHLCLAVTFGGLHVLLGRPRAAAVAGIVLLTLFGPFGGLALMIITPGKAVLRPAADVPAAPAAAPATRNAAEELYDRIHQQRRHPLLAKETQSFLETFRSGSLDEQQDAIAAISRNFHPRMRPALAVALASPVPALRVQAAAVHAKLRGTYGERAKDLLARLDSGDPDQWDGLSMDALSKVAASGFVDDETADRLRQHAPRLADRPLPPAAPDLLHRPSPALQAPPRLKRHACGGLA